MSSLLKFYLILWTFTKDRSPRPSETMLVEMKSRIAWLLRIDTYLLLRLGVIPIPLAVLVPVHYTSASLYTGH